MTEEEKIREGILFCPADPALKAIKLKTHNLNTAYNATREDETEKRAAILSEILGSFGGGFLQGPIFSITASIRTSAKGFSPTST